MKKQIFIGAPTVNREWIIHDWINKTFGAISSLSDDFDFGFMMVSPEYDKGTKAVEDFCLAMNHCFYHVVVEDKKEDDKRHWNHDRYHRMVYLRNLLLDRIRLVNPDYFLSLDTDILLHRDCISNLIDTQKSLMADAVGGKTYMTTRGVMSPSYGMFRQQQVSQGIRRRDSAGVIKVDVIMAIKLMTPAAYAVDYEFHTHGEDLGWSAACKRKGLSLYWDGKVTNKHVMEPRMLNEIDLRVGF